MYVNSLHTEVVRRMIAYELQVKRFDTTRLSGAEGATTGKTAAAKSKK
jgi:hypothetical protein